MGALNVIVTEERLLNDEPGAGEMLWMTGAAPRVAGADKIIATALAMTMRARLSVFTGNLSNLLYTKS